MNTEPALAYRISRDFSGLYCDIHHLGLSSRISKDTTVVKVCCKYFRQEVETALQKKFGNSFVEENIRFQLPQTEVTGINGGASSEE